MNTFQATVEASDEVGPAAIAFAPRQREIVALVAEGFADKEIAVKLGVSARTVRTHLERLYQRYGLHSRSAAVALWLRNGAPGTGAQEEAASDA